MNRFEIDFSQSVRSMKPMHSVNNGPVLSRSISNANYFTEAGIPYARLHDSAFLAAYGGSHSVDVMALFADFNADVNDPASYDFTLTDRYLRQIDATGTKIFYRLGNRIEHEIKKYGTQVPPSFQKWAEICEHIIRHYNEGWADGMHLGIEYWEIWNEPDCRNADGSNPCWQGTEEEFCEMFYVAQKHLKACFPHLKIGGPAICSMGSHAYVRKILERLTRENERVPFDFLSFHYYDCYPERIASSARQARELLDSFGYTQTELILNEWNYIRHWTPAEEMKHNYRVMKGLQGASFIASALCVAQDSLLDHLMYYDARPCAFNGMFQTETLEPLKGYYPFSMFNELFKLGDQVKTATEGSVYGCAASDGTACAALLTRYEDADDAPVQETLIEMSGLPAAAEVRYFLLDAAHDLEQIRVDRVHGGRFATVIPTKLFDSLLITVKQA